VSDWGGDSITNRLQVDAVATSRRCRDVSFAQSTRNWPAPFNTGLCESAWTWKTRLRRPAVRRVKADSL